MNSLEEKSDEVSIVIYDAPRPPRYLKFNKSFLSWMLYGVPTVIGIIISASVVMALLPRKGSTSFSTPSLQLPTNMNEKSDELKMKEASAQIRELEVENQKLQEKLAGTPAEGSDIYFGQILRPYGSQNLTEKSLLQLEQIDFTSDSKKMVLNFQIINPHPEARVTGHIIVFEYSGLETRVYPGVLQNSAIEGIKFSQGEGFAVSRLRPTTAEFSGIPTSNKVKFVIYIFNREGDLLVKHVTRDFEMTTKAQ